MSRISKRCLSLLPLLVGMMVANALGQSEVEPNGTLNQASGPFTLGTVVTGTMSFGDVDYYALQVPSTMDIALAVWGDQIGVCPTTFDPVLTIFNSSGTELSMIDDVGPSYCPLMNPDTAPQVRQLQPGTYYVRVTCIGSQPGQAYHLTTSVFVTPQALTEKFTYQGELKSQGMPFNGYKRMVFSLWADPFEQAIVARISLPVLVQSVEVVDGKFVADLDFTLPGLDDTFDGTERYLEIEIADEDGSNAVVLEPRQRLAATPHAIRALKTSSADTAQTAMHAEVATYAVSSGFTSSAGQANQVPWSGVTGKPPGFADGTDNEGGWHEVSAVCYTSNRVGINTTAPASFDLAVNGTAAKPGGGSWSVFSDERLKHDIEPMSGTLDRLMQLRGYSYEYTSEAVASRLAMPGRQIGLLAQEVERVFPDWVELDEQGYRYVTERATTALMVEALRDLRSEKDRQLKSLQSENQELRARLERLESRLTQPK